MTTKIKSSNIAAGSITADNLDLSGVSTSDISEGSNLYYTDARVQTQLGSVSGHIVPASDITYDLGSATNRFRDLYLSGQTIYLGDVIITKNASTGKIDILDNSQNPVDIGNTYNQSEVDDMIDDIITQIETLAGA